MAQGKQKTEKWLAVQWKISDPFIRNIWNQYLQKTLDNCSGYFPYLLEYCMSSGPYGILSNFLKKYSDMVPWHSQMIVPFLADVWAEPPSNPVNSPLALPFRNSSDHFSSWFPRPLTNDLNSDSEKRGSSFNVSEEKTNLDLLYFLERLSTYIHVNLKVLIYKLEI